MYVRIYQSAKSAMQSGRANTKWWFAKIEDNNSRYIEPLMGWCGTKNNLPQIKLKFSSSENAINYVKKYFNCDFQVIENNPQEMVIKSYADNFTDY